MSVIVRDYRDGKNKKKKEEKKNDFNHLLCVVPARVCVCVHGFLFFKLKVFLCL